MVRDCGDKPFQENEYSAFHRCLCVDAAGYPFMIMDHGALT